MINLLPLEEKQKLFLKKKEKLTIIWGIVILVSLVCLTLILLSIKFYILAETDYQKNMLKQAEQENQTPDVASLTSTIKKYNVILAQLDSFYTKEIHFNQVLKIITDISKPKNLYLTSFSLSRDKTGAVQLIVAGISDTRENLLVFKKNIEQDQKIENPYFSPESWLNPTNANFSLTFKVNFNENQQ